MADLRLFGSTSNLVRFTLKNSSTGAGLTGLTGSSSGLIISTINDVEATATAYTAGGSNIQTIATLGTYAAPSASDCRFAQVDATNHPGLYEFQIADARFAVTNAKRLIISVSGATNLLNADYEIELVQFNPFDGTHLGLTSLPNVATGNAGALLTSGTGTAQLSVTAGVASANATQINGVATTSIATINANLGTTQALTFDGNNYLKVDVVDIAGTASAGVAGYIAPDWSHVNAPTSTVALTGTTISSSQVVASVTGAVGSVTGAVGSVTSLVTANTTQLAGQTVTAAAGVTFPASVASPTNITAGTITTVSGNVNGSVGSVVGAVGSVTAQVSANVTAINAISTSSVTTVSAYQGQTSAILFDSNGAVKADTVDWLGQAVNANVAGYPVVDIGYTLGTASKGAAGYVAPDWSKVGNPTATVNLSATTIATSQVVASVTGAVGSVIGAVGSVTGSVGSISGITFPTHFNLLAIDGSGDVTFNNSTIASVTTVSSVTGNVGGNVVGSVASVVTQVTANVTAINAIPTTSVTTVSAVQGTTKALTFDTNNYPSVNIVDIAGYTTAGTNLGNVYLAIPTGTAQAGGSSSITLANTSSSVSGFYNSQAIFLVSGTGAGQTNNITNYSGSPGYVATVETPWATVPDSSTVYIIVGRIG